MATCLVLLFLVQIVTAKDESFTQYSDFVARNESFFEWIHDILNNGSLTPEARDCYEDVAHVVKNWDSKWAMQMADSWGKVPSGALVGGSGLWTGDYAECVGVRAPVKGIYCVATWSIQVPEQLGFPLRRFPMKTGLCLPSSCNNSDAKKDFQHIAHYLRLLLPASVGRHLQPESLSCKGSATPPLSTAAYVFVCLVGAYLLVVLAGSSLTVVEYFLRRGHTPHSSFIELESDESLDLEHLEGIVKVSGNSFLASVSKYLKCFCVLSNGAKILDTSSPSDPLTCIHGIRFLSMTWVVLGHTYIHNLDVIGNLLQLLRSADSLAFQVIVQGTYSVDTFFVISGFLLAHLYLRGNARSWWGLVLHRLLRITPVYAVLVCFAALVYPSCGSGPFWDDEGEAGCQRRWWWNLLYLNNFLPMDEMCLTWTWYLADDFQFFLFGMLLLHCARVWKRPLLSRAIGVVSFLGSILVTLCISYSYHLFPLFAGISTAPDYTLYKDRLVRTWDLIYTKPYCRIGPYLLGMGAAVLARRTRPLCKVYKAVGWFVALLLCVGVVYGAGFIKEGGAIPHLYNALSRTMFGAGVSWLIYCCVTENAELIRRLLSWKAWIPLSRITFCAYLLHPLLMSGYFDSQATPIHFSQMNRVMLFFSFLFVSYAAAFIVSVLFEAPVINIEKLVRQKYSTK